jgi:hypothetical protein
MAGNTNSDILIVRPNDPKLPFKEKSNQCFARNEFGSDISIGRRNRSIHRRSSCISSRHYQDSDTVARLCEVLHEFGNWEAKPGFV